MDGINIIKRPRLKKPYMIVAWPGMGEVAFKAATYLVEGLKMQEFASMPSEEFFFLTGSVIKDGVLDMPDMPQSRFYYWKNPACRPGVKTDGRDLIIFISNSQPDLSKAEVYSQRIIGLAKSFKVETIIGFASLPQAVDHTQEAAVWFAATHQELKDELKKHNFNFLPEGLVSGMNGLFLGLAKKAGLKGFCLLGEIPLYTIQIENPKASWSVLKAFLKIINIRLDLGLLSEQAHNMEGEISKLLDYLKITPQVHPGPIGEEEIEKIKKSLAQLTRLPASVKEKIEKLFRESGSDISRANELKSELDMWSVYKEYEDRFLDLFRKNDDKGD